MTDKEQIMNDLTKYNPCNGCKLWNGHHCIGARSYEPNADEHKAICNDHIATQFYKVYQQLFYKTQECKELKAYAQRQENQREEYYKEYLKKDKALEEIKKAFMKINNLIFDPPLKLYGDDKNVDI